MTIYDNIRAYCDANGLTIKEFERRCSLANACVRKWKTGGASGPRLTTIIRISDATGIPVDKWVKEGGIRGRSRHKKD